MAIAFLAIPVILLLIYLAIYNGLVGKKNDVLNSFSTIDVMLKKRYDLIPNLVSTVKQYMEHEKNTLENITKYRSKAMSGNVSSEEAVSLNNMIGKDLGKIMIAVENYPDLKANQNFMQLQRSLNEIEEQLSASRRTYNAVVTDYNNALEMFPSNIVAGMMAYKRKELFVAESIEKKNVNIGNLFK